MRRLDRGHRAIPVVIGAIALAIVAVLFAWDAFPGLFPPRAHDLLGALPLALIAFAYLAYQVIRRPAPLESLAETSPNRNEPGAAETGDRTQ